MALHGNNPQQNVIAIVPARYASTRLPGKMLLDIAGKPLILRTLEQAMKASTVSRVIVATDDERIYQAVIQGGGEARMTSAEHVSGSDRIAEVARDLPQGSIIVNVQGDEPLISPDTIDAAVEALIADDAADMSTTCEPISSIRGELLNGNVVKVVVSDRGNALYFSRSPMPFPREASLRHGGDPGLALEDEPELMTNFRKHTGIYVYRREYLLRFTKLPPTRLEQIEMLEQLRALEDGAKIRVVEAVGHSIGVDTQADLDRVRAIVALPDIIIRAAKAEDIPAVAAVHVDSWQRSFRHIAPDEYLDNMAVKQRIERFSERFSKPSYYLIVAECKDGEVAGFVDYGKSVLNADFEAQIYSFYLLPQFQRLGLGGKLFKYAVAEMVELGYRSLCLDSLEASPYRRFYEKTSGKIVGRDLHKLGTEDFNTVIYGWDNLEKI